MHQLGDQWIELIDGAEHMLKAVNYSDGCNGCIFLRYDPDEFYTCNRGRLGCPVDDEMIIKDLGILNEDGCLPNSWGEYPKIERSIDVGTGIKWYRCITRNDVYCATNSYATEREAIDAWNRRA